MHLVNDMITLLPQNAAVPSSVTSPASMTSPALTCYPTGQYNAFSFNGIPSAAANLTCFQAGMNGYTVNGLPSTVNGYALQTIPSNCGMGPNNVTISGINGPSVSPTTPPVTNNCTITGCQNGTISISGLAMPPPNALTAPEVYGLPPASMMTKKTSSSTSDSSSSSDGSPAPLSPAASMELVWHGEFDRLFAQYFPHMWCLVPTFYPPSDSWRTFKDSAKVRFSCQECGHGWTSMKGRVVFWFDLNYATNAGCVMFKLYGQQCQRCKTGKFEHAMWYPEEVVKVIGNVYNRVGQIHYGFVRPPLRIDRRVGKPRNQHNAELCQACKEGLCKEEWSFA